MKKEKLIPENNTVEDVSGDALMINKRLCQIVSELETTGAVYFALEEFEQMKVVFEVVIRFILGSQLFKKINIKLEKTASILEQCSLLLNFKDKNATIQ